MMKNKFALLLLLAPFVASCQTDTTTSSIVSTDKYINVGVDFVEIMEDSTYQIEVEIIKQGTFVFYSSSNPEVASVDDKGLVTGLAEGTANITVRGGRDSYLIEFNVTKYQAKDTLQLTLTKTNFTLEEGDTFILPLSVYFGVEMVEPETLEYDIGDKSVVFINGKIMSALSAGTTKVVANATYSSYSASIGFNVTVY